MKELFPVMAGSVFDRFVEEFPKWDDVFPDSTYPYNVKQYQDGTFIIEFALAGFSKDDISVTVNLKNELEVVVNKTKEQPEETPPNMLHHGIARRSLHQRYRFDAAIDEMGITSTFKDGLLSIRIPPVKRDLHRIQID